MGVIIGAIFGLGSWLIFQSFIPKVTKQSVRSRVDNLLLSAGITTISGQQFQAVCVVLAGFGFLVCFSFSGSIPVAICFAVILGYCPLSWLRSRRVSRQLKLAADWPTAIDNLNSAVRAGMSLPAALAGLGERGPISLRSAFVDFGVDFQISGRFNESLDFLKLRLSDPTGDRVVESLRIAREVGGSDLGKILRTLASYLRAEQNTRSELLARQSWAINGARLAVSAPWLVLLMLSFQPAIISRFNSATGVLVLALGGCACWVSYWLMLRIGRLPIEKRIWSRNVDR